MNESEQTPANSPAEKSHRMQCMELWGGFSATATTVNMTGLHGQVVSKPYQKNQTGGDVYYFTSCASGRISRILLADVSGHGDSASETASQLRTIMRRNVNVISHRRLMTSINREFARTNTQGRFATAVVITYFARGRLLSVSSAGHPLPLFFRQATGKWSLFGQAKSSDSTAAADGDRVKVSRAKGGLPLGISEESGYDRASVTFEPGDMLFAYTDAFSEWRDGAGEYPGINGLLSLANSCPPDEREQFILWLSREIRSQSADNLDQDDATGILIQPTADGIPVKNNLLAPFLMLRGVREDLND